MVREEKRSGARKQQHYTRRALSLSPTKTVYHGSGANRVFLSPAGLGWEMSLLLRILYMDMMRSSLAREYAVGVHNNGGNIGGMVEYVANMHII